MTRLFLTEDPLETIKSHTNMLAESTSVPLALGYERNTLQYIYRYFYLAYFRTVKDGKKHSRVE